MGQHGDIEVNLEPREKAAVEHFSSCHWNVNRLATHESKKVSLLEAYNAIHHYDIDMCFKNIMTLQYQMMKKIFQLKDTL